MSVLAVNGGEPLRREPFFQRFVHGEEENRAVAEVVENGRWGHIIAYPMLFGNDVESISKVESLSEKFQTYYGTEYAIPVTNGSEALEIALRNAGVGYGDEVITTPTTWLAPAMAAVLVGADPVFVDIHPDTYCIDPERIEEAITPRTKAVIAVHLGGYPCDMEAIMRIAERHGLKVIEDCAQAHGTRINGKLVGSFGHFGCFSFEISKFMTAGEGGMVIGSYDALEERVYGFLGRSWSLIWEKLTTQGRKLVGWNARMTEMQAALLEVQLTRIEEQKALRRKNAARLNDRLAQIGGITPLRQAPDQNFYTYIMKYDASAFAGVPKEAFIQALNKEGVPCSSHHQLTYRNDFFYSPRVDYSRVRCPVAERAYDEEAIYLPAFWMLLGSEKDMDDIADAICKIKEHAGELAAVMS